MDYDIVIATGNAGKAVEIAEILAGRGGSAGSLTVRTIKEAVGFVPDAEENGDTLTDNARIKAAAARKALDAHAPERKDIIVAADDSGLFVDCLGGRPGVRSARYRGAEAARAEDGGNNTCEPPTPSEQIELLLAEIRGLEMPHDAVGNTGDANSTGTSDARVPGAPRTASFRCVMAISYPDGSEGLAEGECCGEIAQKPSGGNGFGYDPVFYLPQMGRTMAELTPAEKNVVSHRGKAVRRMLDDIDVFLSKGAT